MRERWGRAFEILEVVPNVHNMSWALMRKRDLELSVGDLERPGNDPREYHALKHNLKLVQREVEFWQAASRNVRADTGRE